MLQPVTAQKILTPGRASRSIWPGRSGSTATRINVIAGLIVEKASGEPLLQFCRKRYLHPST